MPGNASRENGKKGGRPPGPAQATIDKALKREELRRIVCEELEPMTRAQMAHAKGISYMVLRQKDGTFTRATDVKQLDAALAAGASTFQIFTQAPNTQAFTDLMNRALDKPAEQVQLTGAEGQPLEIHLKIPW